MLLEAHGPGGVLELSDEKKAALQPPLTAGRMPSMVEAAAPKKKKKKPVSAGFGGFGGGKKKR